ncbi:hypothetical protein LINPERHAP2_LOCUS37004 [Linum perenne]
MICSSLLLSLVAMLRN